MAEPLKDMYNETFLTQFGTLIHSEWTSFDVKRFITLIMGEGWEQLELKGRIRRITESLGQTLPLEYKKALDVLYAIDERCVGFPYLFFPDFVEVYGANHWDLSMDALERFTIRSSSEFAIRPFLLAQTDRAMEQMNVWAQSSNEHIRRLASEGCRPRLPWAPALPMFKHDPSAILPIMERLKRDSSLYVRKSVANNLNDIAKDHPDIVRQLAAEWIGEDPLTDWIVRRACRTLIRAADPITMKLFGYADEAAVDIVASASITPNTPAARIGEKSALYYSIHIQTEATLKLRVELGVDYVKASGKVSQKKFLILDRTVNRGERIEGTKLLDWKDLSTRKHYLGDHRLSLLVNGQHVAETSVRLQAAEEQAHAEIGQVMNE